MISKEAFCQTIESLRLQVVKDKEKSELLRDVFNVDFDFPYDNFILFKAIIFLLHLYFPRDSDDFSEIEHYCFSIEFGKYKEQEIITSEDLYDHLISKP
jgi:hypothetical protein